MNIDLTGKIALVTGATGELGRTIKLIWVPRALLIAFIFFFSLFALDAFTGNASFLNELWGFAVHLTPSFIMVIFLAFTWKRPAVAGWLFIALGIAFTFFFRTYAQFPVNFIIISLPPAVIGALFLISALPEKKRQG